MSKTRVSDGRWRWDGRQWLPVQQAPPLYAPVATPAVAPVAATGLACQWCGGQPAIRITLRQHIGALFVMIFRRWRFVCCRDCGIALFRQKQNETLMSGWWGFFSFLAMNWFAIISNLVARSALLQLPEPVGAQGARHLDPGRPIWRRSGMIVVAGVMLLVLVVVVYDALSSR